MEFTKPKKNIKCFKLFKVCSILKIDFDSIIFIWKKSLIANFHYLHLWYLIKPQITLLKPYLKIDIKCRLSNYFIFEKFLHFKYVENMSMNVKNIYYLYKILEVYLPCFGALEWINTYVNLNLSFNVLENWLVFFWVSAYINILLNLILFS